MAYFFITLMGEQKTLQEVFTNRYKSVNMSIMKYDQRGAISLLSIFSTLVTLLFIVAVITSVVFYKGENKYKNNSNQLISSAVATAVENQQTTDRNVFAKESLQPLQPFVGPEAYGTVTVYYPKTYSAYIVVNSGNSIPVNGYFQPGFVPDTTNEANAFALRLQVDAETYDQELVQYTSFAKQGLVTITAYSLPKVPSVIGVKITGKIATNVQSGIMIILPLRNTTLQVWTEAPQYESNFNTLILPNLSFSP
jgi:hypothetical protein